MLSGAVYLQTYAPTPIATEKLDKGLVNYRMFLAASVVISLRLESNEYELGQFPGLIYRASEADSVVLLFASGRVVITGSPNLDAAEQTFATLQDE